MTPPPCPICARPTAPLDVVDFNKSCAESWGDHLPLSGTPVYYFLCDHCGHCHAPEFRHWGHEEFRRRIYNDDYVRVDPDYVERRPASCAAQLVQVLGAAASSIRHLDYGGGSGRLSELLRGSGWNSRSYDPFVTPDIDPGGLGTFDLITAYEIFEHAADAHHLMSNMSSLLAEDGLMIVSTLLSDGERAPRRRLTWWYASPRNGHISLFSRNSLTLLATTYGFRLGGTGPGLHILLKTIPPWARHFIRAS
jgi:SAM-dependent methyltransferase